MYSKTLISLKVPDKKFENIIIVATIIIILITVSYFYFISYFMILLTKEINMKIDKANRQSSYTSAQQSLNNLYKKNAKKWHKISNSKINLK